MSLAVLLRKPMPRAVFNKKVYTRFLIGSISSRFVSPRSLPHTTAGSLVYPLYFLTNHRKPCSNRAGFPVIGQFCHSCLSNMAAEEFCSVKCVLERFHIEKFRETQQEVIVSLLEEKDVLVSLPAASEKYVIFIPSRSYASSMLRR